jgi:ABC-type Fe3+ transport system substrate-binding protein
MPNRPRRRSLGLSRRDFLRIVAALGGQAVFAACGPAATGQPTGAAASAPAGGAAGAGAPAAAGWEQEWNATLAAARQEGRVIVIGRPGTQFRRVLVDEFQGKFPGISVDYSGIEGSEAMPKILAERQAGKYLVDLHIGGPATPMRSLLPVGGLDPIEPALILPEVKDTSVWLQNRRWYMDNAGQYALAYAGSAAPGTAITYNTRQLDPRTVSSWQDLLLPQWKDRIASADPNILGTMRGDLTSLAANPELGLDYLRKLYAPEHGVRLSADPRMLLDWVAQGQYAIGLGLGAVHVDEASRLGLPVAWMRLKESFADLAPQGNCVMLVNQAPHPNAARVYLNWLLSRDGQIAYQKAVEAPSWRMDVPRDGLRPEDIPQASVQYEVTQHEKFLPLRDEVQQLIKQLGASR